MFVRRSWSCSIFAFLAFCHSHGPSSSCSPLINLPDRVGAGRQTTHCTCCYRLITNPVMADLSYLSTWLNTATRTQKRFIALLIVAVPIVPRLLSYFRLPPPPKRLGIAPSLEIAPINSRPRTIYPDDIFDGGSYASSPYGKVRGFVNEEKCSDNELDNGLIDEILASWA